jgi:carbamoyl-phosphate synthase large subunit
MGKSFHELRVWQLSMDLVEWVYKLTSEFPRREMYGLPSQMRRAAVSIPSNIAEGQARQSQKEFLRFISTAKGSLAELETQTHLAKRLHYITEDAQLRTVAACDDIGRLLSGLHAAIADRVASTTRNEEQGTRDAFTMPRRGRS